MLLSQLRTSNGMAELLANFEQGIPAYMFTHEFAEYVCMLSVCLCVQNQYCRNKSATPQNSVLSLLDCVVHWHLGCLQEQFLPLRASHMHMKCICVLSSARTQEGNHDSKSRHGFEVNQR